MGVGTREMGFLHGQYRRLAGHSQVKMINFLIFEILSFWSFNFFLLLHLVWQWIRMVSSPDELISLNIYKNQEANSSHI